MASSNKLIGEEFVYRYLDPNDLAFREDSLPLNTATTNSGGISRISPNENQESHHHALLQTLLSRGHEYASNSNQSHPNETTISTKSMEQHASNDQCKYANRMIVLGPSKSGKTSLIMDYAYSITSSFSTCTNPFMKRRRVTILRHSSRKHEETTFPLFSHQCPNMQQYVNYDYSNSSSSQQDKNKCATDLENEHERASVLFRTRMELIERQHLESMSALSTAPYVPDAPPTQNDNNSNSCQDQKTTHKQALEQIDIQYISSINDLIRYFAVIPLLSLDKRPSGGIFLDDLHLFFKDTSTQTAQTNRDVSVDVVSDDELMMKLIQLLALTASSANFLDSSSFEQFKSGQFHFSHKPTPIIFTWNIAVITLPQHIQQMMSNYFPYFATIAKSSAPTGNQPNFANYNNHAPSIQSRLKKYISSEWKIDLSSCLTNDSGLHLNHDSENRLLAAALFKTCCSEKNMYHNYGSDENSDKLSKKCELLWILT